MKPEISILANCTSGGCGAKIEAGALGDLLSDLPNFASESLKVGYDTSDDAAVYQINDKQSIVSTVDFFSPMVDDPYLFGEIAATNALSDVYAMGASPLFALNLVCFPEDYPKEILAQILAGGANKMIEAGAALAGGHSIYDKETKYGLAVTGMVENDKIIRNNTPKIGDALILTKPLGVGIVMAALRVDEANQEAIKAATDSMSRLNKYAAEAMANYTVNACTDITGFGLLVHLKEMCGNNFSAKIYAKNLPLLPNARKYAEGYMITAAGQRNRLSFGQEEDIQSLSFALQELLFDPQTSGGLLISVKEEEAEELLSVIRKTDPCANIVGQVLVLGEKKIVIEE